MATSQARLAIFDLSVDSEKPASESRKRLSPNQRRVRQTRYDGREINGYIQIKDRTCEVLNYSLFGISFVSNQRVDSTTIDAVLFVDGSEVERVKLRQVRDEFFSDTERKISCEVLDKPLSLNRMIAIWKAKSIIRVHRMDVAEFDGIPARFRQFIYQIKDGLESLEKQVNGLPSAVVDNFEKTREFDEEVSIVVAAQIKDIMKPFYDEIPAMVETMTKEAVNTCRKFVASKLGHILHQSPFAERAFSKPLGYAGDYESMNIIYRDESVGASLFAKSLHKYYVNDPNSKAVRNRARYLKNKIETFVAENSDKQMLKILSVACGPAYEVQLLMESMTNFENVEFTFLDQDLSALKDAQSSVQRMCQKLGKKLSCRYIHKSVKDILFTALDDERYDFIYSAGLFDYFTDRVAYKAASTLHKMLREGGHLIVGNFMDKASSKAVMDLALNWHLVYRTEDELRRLYHDISENLYLDKEPEGINLFINFTR